MLQISFKIDSSFVNFSARDKFNFANLIDKIFWAILVSNIWDIRQIWMRYSAPKQFLDDSRKILGQLEETDEDKTHIMW